MSYETAFPYKYMVFFIVYDEDLDEVENFILALSSECIAEIEERLIIDKEQNKVFYIDDNKTKIEITKNQVITVQTGLYSPNLIIYDCYTDFFSENHVED